MDSMGFLPWYQLVGAGSPKAYKLLPLVLRASLNCAKILSLTAHPEKSVNRFEPRSHTEHRWSRSKIWSFVSNHGTCNIDDALHVVMI
jgi:hypothetical protein